MWKRRVPGATFFPPLACGVGASTGCRPGAATAGRRLPAPGRQQRERALRASGALIRFAPAEALRAVVGFEGGEGFFFWGGLGWGLTGG
jgi:hypothetical protein